MTVNNIADLRAAAATTEVVFVLGYYSENDGGGGEFYLDTSSTENDNGGTIIEPDVITGRWKRIIKNDIINVLFFGAKGDGTTDDYSTIIKARNFASPNYTLLFPSNHTFYISQNLDFSIVDGNPITKLKIEGIITGDAGNELIVGYVSTQARPVNITINQVNTITIRAQGLKNGQIYIHECPRLIVWADGDNSQIQSTAYSHFYLGRCEKVEIKSNVDAVASGWINENFFYGGRIKSFEMDGNYSHNHNIFFTPTFEESLIYFKKGAFNTIYNCRLEGSSSITFEEGTTNNVIHKNWYNFAGNILRNTSIQSYTDNGYDNEVVADLDTILSFEEIYSMTPYSRNYNLENITRNLETLTFGSTRDVWTTGLIPLGNNPFGIFFNSDASIFRVKVTFYLSDGTQYTGSEPIGNNLVSSTFLSWNLTSNAYITSSNRNNLQVAIGNPGTTGISFVSFRIYNSTSGEISFAKIRVKKNKAVLLNIPVLTENKELTSTTAPTSGEWQEGDRIYSSVPNTTGYLGWICINSGTPGTWIPFGSINIDLGKATEGITSLRPVVSTIGYQYFDTTLGLPIWWNGSNWIDSSGSII